MCLYLHAGMLFNPVATIRLPRPQDWGLYRSVFVLSSTCYHRLAVPHDVDTGKRKLNCNQWHLAAASERRGREYSKTLATWSIESISSGQPTRWGYQFVVPSPRTQHNINHTSCHIRGMTRSLKLSDCANFFRNVLTYSMRICRHAEQVC
jgi:hypothetical protein